MIDKFWNWNYMAYCNRQNGIMCCFPSTNLGLNIIVYCSIMITFLLLILIILLLYGKHKQKRKDI